MAKQPTPKKQVAKSQDNSVIGWIKSKAAKFDSALSAAPPIGVTRAKGAAGAVPAKTQKKK